MGLATRRVVVFGGPGSLFGNYGMTSEHRKQTNFSVDRDIIRELCDTYKHMQMKVMKCKCDL